MSTRALYTFKDADGEYHVYKHHDGYPSGAVDAIRDALARVWPLPRFEADEFAAAFVAASKPSPGGVRLTTGRRWFDAASGDCQYHYVVSMVSRQLNVEVFSIQDVADHRQTQLFIGSLPAVAAWANKDEEEVAASTAPVIVAVNESGDHRTGTLSSKVSAADIEKVLGFKANIDDDTSKVRHSWGFTVNGQRCGIWDYKGSRWSVFDPAGVLPLLFAGLVTTP